MIESQPHFFSKYHSSLKWLILLAGILLYANTIHHQFVLDDYSVIVNHSHVQKGLSGISEIMSTNYRHGNSGFNDGLYRPLSLVTFALEKEIFNSNTSIAHIINILLYAFGCMFLFLALSKIFKHSAVLFPFLISLLFLCHPIHTEVVANVKGRDELLAFLGFALCLYFLLKKIETGKAGYLFAAIFAYLICLFSKESAVTFALLIPLLLLLNKDISFKSAGLHASFLLPFAIAFILLRVYIINKMTSPVDPGNFSLLNNPIAAQDDTLLKWGSVFALQLTFFKKLVFPFQLLHDYSYNQLAPVGLFSWQSISGMVIYISLMTASVWGIIKRNILGIIAAIYLLSTVVASQIFYTIGVQFAERMLFIAVLPLAVFLLILLDKVIKKSSLQANSRKKAMLIAFLPVLLFSFKTIDRNKDWENDYTLFKADIKNGKKSARVNYNYGTELYEIAQQTSDPTQKQKYLQESVGYLITALKIYPDYKDGYNNLGLAYQETGNFKNAVGVFKQGIQRDPTYSKYYFNLGTAYYKNKQYKEAIQAYKEYLKLNPSSAYTYSLMGQAAGNISDFNAAITYLSKATQLDPNNSVNYNFLGLSYGMIGQHANAEQSFINALKTDARNTNILMNLAMSYHQQGKVQAEKNTLQKIVAINPNHATAKNRLKSL